MQISICARGFPLTAALRHAIEQEARDFARSFAARAGQLSVRLYDINGSRGGNDKACLVQARIGRKQLGLVATDIDADMYRAIAGAFARLERGARRALARSRALRRRPVTRPPEPAAGATA